MKLFNPFSLHTSFFSFNYSLQFTWLVYMHCERKQAQSVHIDKILLCAKKFAFFRTVGGIG